jgi:hypothetical protein
MGESRCPRCNERDHKYHVCPGWNDPRRKEVEEPDPAQENLIRALEDQDQ